MSAKQFFKSTTFKCIITLLCVLLVSGVFLTIMSGLLAVTDQERFDRAINKIYGKPVKYSELQSADYNDNGTIDGAYLIEDGNYLIKATGTGGYDNGTVTCWVVVEVENKTIKGIGKVVIDSNKNQSYIDRVTSKALDQFSEFYEDDIVYSPSLITGATVMGTKNAICNAVNAALDYVRVQCGGVESEAKKLLKNVAAIYGDKEVEVYGLGADGSDVLISETDESITSFIAADVTEGVGNATIHSLYKIKYTEDEKEVLHYLISSTGSGGFENGKGTVTTLTSLIIENGTIAGVYKVIITANVGQSYIDKINHLDKYPEAEYTEGFEFSTNNGFVSSGASWSSAAINNAVNGAIKYVTANIDKLYTAPEGGDEEDELPPEEGGDEENEGGNDNE